MEKPPMTMKKKTLELGPYESELKAPGVGIWRY